MVQLTLTSAPASALPSGIDHPWDLAAHLGLYGILGLLIARAAAFAGWSASRLLLAWLAVAGAAVLDELHQLFIPGRDAAALDWVCDFSGAAAGLRVGTRVMASRLAVWLS